MSNLPHNLSLLRRRAGYTQEELAEALNVSRQAVGKWESGQTMPEAATLLTLADLLGCSLDQLMREALVEGDELPPEVPDFQAEADWALFQAYDRHMDRFAFCIAGGVVMVLLGVAALLLYLAILGGPYLIIPLFAFLSIAVFLFLYGGISHAQFRRNCPVVPSFYPPEEVARSRKLFAMGLGAAVSGILADVALLVTLVLSQCDLSVALFMAVLALCVGAIIWLAIRRAKYRLPGTAQLPVEYDGNASPSDDHTSGIMMLCCALVYLLFGFLRGMWHPGWIVFVAGGILCAIYELTKN